MTVGPETSGALVTRDEMAIDPVVAARRLLGCVVESRLSVADGDAEPVAVRLVEVEAYRGADDPASHCYRGRTARNEVMFGPAGHLYVYFVYGMHFCANVVCLTDGVAGAVLLRGAEVISGVETARARRATARSDAELARGPARLTSTLGLHRAHDGIDLTDPDSPVRLRWGTAVPAASVRNGPRVGVASAIGTPWRFWVDGSSAVSSYRRGGRRRTPALERQG
ncbi:DNA-3-methyladenine glycosylase [Actinoalloteichus hoggarensis]|uniref:Putative 3-methyladenine DNA glycosylase n=1 Tax=Actinoalloteichus hoggarensis TaxID=1470176 RepID=A0A221W6Y6_9PSEU|nr:DNA-3-methyladenine glycosylase [Actinoalloteichus hoggarensis]ASO21433.1 3-methyladenine DNA glycosylase [Actinoalloteichus hoggarensis]MBB5922022.1 DNA-3-methyladenine glycosylase [Actinoalloteichus hoggarensis]